MKLMHRILKLAVFVTATLLIGIIAFYFLEIFHDISEDRRIRIENEFLRRAVAETCKEPTPEKAAEVSPADKNVSAGKIFKSPEIDSLIGEESLYQGDSVPLKVDFSVLKKINEDIKAWIYVPDTHINYPILKGDDNDYYLHRLPDRSYAVAGSLFMDFRCSPDFSDSVTVVYGHHMKNGTMFRDLEKYKNQKFYEKHPVYWLFTESMHYRVDIFAGYVTDTDDPVFDIVKQEDSVYAPERTNQEKNSEKENGKESGESCGNNKEVLKGIVGRAYSKSSFKSEVEVKDDDCILVLSTCSYEFDNARYVLLGVLREIPTEIFLRNGS